MNQLSLFPAPALAWPAGPQLLSKWYPGALAFPLHCERKVNGFRCMIHVSADGRGRAYSREGNVLVAGQLVADAVARAAGPGVWDGELAGDTFRETVSAVKRRSPAGLRFHAWDVLSLPQWAAGGTDDPLELRRGCLQALRGVPAVEVVASVLVHDEGELDARFRVAICEGWEGLVLKRPGSPYRCGLRSADWCKMKPGRPECW